jgi:hypothetical protein
MTVRVLKATDWLSMGRLRLGQSRHAGTPVSQFTSNPLATVSPVYQEDPHRAVGHFDKDGVLDSFVCAFAGEGFWVLDLMVSDENPRNLRVCLEHLLQFYESRGAYQFYYAFPLKWARAYRSFWKDGSETLRKYTIEDVTVIQPNRVPQDPWIWENVLHEIVIPTSLLVRRSFVSSQFINL